MDISSSRGVVAESLCDATETRSVPVYESKIVPVALAKSIASTRVEYRHVGSSGLRVSNPILGTLGMGDPSWMPWAMAEDKVVFDEKFNERSSP